MSGQTIKVSFSHTEFTGTPDELGAFLALRVAETPLEKYFRLAKEYNCSFSKHTACDEPEQVQFEIEERQRALRDVYRSLSEEERANLTPAQRLHFL